jgi:hypothetical protein
VYSTVPRWVEAALRVAAFATSLAIAGRAALGVLAGPPPSAREVVLGMGWGALLPWLAAVAIRRSRRVRLSVDETRLALHGRGPPVEVPRSRVLGLRAWRLPLPGPGFRVALEDGGHLDLLLPPGAARALGVPEEGAGAGMAERFALARRIPSPWLAAFKFGVYPLPPALILFRVNQIILYGGFLGEYHLHGPGRWAQGLLEYWATTLASVAAWAAPWRALAEAASLLGARAGPVAAARVRRGAEIAAGLAYYLAIPAVLAMLFLR